MIDLAAIRHQATTEATTLTAPSDQPHLGGSIRGGIGDPMTYCPSLWAWAVGLLKAESVLDLGCGHGYSTACFRQLVGLDVLGVDGDAQAIKNAVCDIPLIRHDFSQEQWIPGKIKTDLIWCCEFLEHVEERHLDNVFQAFSCGKTIMITHAIPGQGGHHHVNEQPMGYWVMQFLKRGFILDENMTACARLVAAADRHLLGLATDNYFMRTGLVFRNQNA